MFNLFVLLAALLSLASATLSQFAPIPSQARIIALDEINKRFIIFDHEGRELGVRAMNSTLSKRDGAGSCIPMTNPDISKRMSFFPLRFKLDSSSFTPKVPGIQKLRDEASKFWFLHSHAASHPCVS